MANLYRFYSDSGKQGGDAVRLEWVAVDPPDAPPIVRRVSAEQMANLENHRVLDSGELTDEAAIDKALGIEPATDEEPPESN